MADAPLSTTSFAMLGYLSVQPWSAYELTKQLGRTFHHFWPRAESGIYREVKRLETEGLARSKTERVGLRNRTRYEITAAGRKALRAWVTQPQSNGFLECEGLVRVLFADNGTLSSLRRQLEEMDRDAEATAEQMRTIVRDYVVAGGEFPERAHVNLLVAKFLIDFAAMVHDWTEWSGQFVDSWPDVAPRSPDKATMAQFREVAGWPG